MRQILLLIIICIALLVCVPIAGADAPNPAAAPVPQGMNAPAPAESDAPMTDIFDIKPLEAVAFSPQVLTIVMIALIGAAILAAVLAVIYFIKKRRAPAAPDIPSLEPHETALQLLDDLEKRPAPDPREFYFNLSMIFRAYVEGRFRLDAPEMTSEELLPRLKDLPLDQELHQGARSFLLASDPVKFAGQQAGCETMTAHLAFVRQFVRQTMPLESDASGDVLAVDTHTAQSTGPVSGSGRSSTTGVQHVSGSPGTVSALLEK